MTAVGAKELKMSLTLFQIISKALAAGAPPQTPNSGESAFGACQSDAELKMVLTQFEKKMGSIHT